MQYIEITNRLGMGNITGKTLEALTGYPIQNVKW